MKSYNKLNQNIVKSWLESLSVSSRIYSRMLKDFTETDNETRKNFVKWLNVQEVKTITQFIFAVEQ